MISIERESLEKSPYWEIDSIVSDDTREVWIPVSFWKRLWNFMFHKKSLNGNQIILNKNRGIFVVDLKYGSGGRKGWAFHCE